MPERKHLIFLSYRGSDEIWATEFVYARMTEAFGEETVFKAGNALPPGDAFPAALLEKAASCPVMLACVGPGWLTAQNAEGRRLESPEDWVRREIAISLQAGNRVIALLLGDAGAVAPPNPSELPDDLRAMFAKQAWRLTPGGGLDLTVPRLIEKLVELVPALRERWRAVAEDAAATGNAAATGTPTEAGHIHNEISGGTQNAPVVFGRDFSGDITF